MQPTGGGAQEAGRREGEQPLAIEVIISMLFQESLTGSGRRGREQLQGAYLLEPGGGAQEGRRRDGKHPLATKAIVSMLFQESLTSSGRRGRVQPQGG
eukprot:10438203-Heterocapsa_arctica.AAC.1